MITPKTMRSVRPINSSPTTSPATAPKNNNIPFTNMSIAPPLLDPNLVANIKIAEGLSLSAYLDSVGVWTIGYGHTPCKEGDTCTLAQAEAWLEADIATAAKEAALLPEARGIDPQRLAALSELLFNLGGHKWGLFTKTRAAIADREWQRAHDELLKSKWAGQVGSTRSTRLASMLLTGQ